MGFGRGDPLVPCKLDGFAFRRFILYPFLLKPFPILERGGIRVRYPLLAGGRVLNAPIRIPYRESNKATLGITRPEYRLEKRRRVQCSLHVLDHARSETLQRRETHLGHGSFYTLTEGVTFRNSLDILPHLGSIGTDGPRVQEIIDAEGLEGHTIRQAGRRGAEPDLVRIETYTLYGLRNITDGTSDVDAQLGWSLHRIGGVVRGAEEAEFVGNSTGKNGGSLLGALLGRFFVWWASKFVIGITNQILEGGHWSGVRVLLFLMGLFA